MGKLLRDLGPLALAVAVFALVIGYLLASGNGIGNWLLAAFLFGHGWIHMMYVMPRPRTSTATADGPAWPFNLDGSWVAGGSALHGLGMVLVAVTVVGYSLAALASISLIVSPELWAPLVIVATIASALLMGLFFDPGLMVGLAIDAGLIAVVVLTNWAPV